MQHVTLSTLDVGRIGLGATGMPAAYTGADDHHNQAHSALLER